MTPRIKSISAEYKNHNLTIFLVFCAVVKLMSIMLLIHVLPTWCTDYNFNFDEKEKQ